MNAYGGMEVVALAKVACFLAFCVVVITIGAIIIVKTLKKPATKQQLMEYNSYKELANELKETNKEMRKELVDLTEKVSSIEKILKEVE